MGARRHNKGGVVDPVSKAMKRADLEERERKLQPKQEADRKDDPKAASLRAAEEVALKRRGLI